MKFRRIFIVLNVFFCFALHAGEIQHVQIREKKNQTQIYVRSEDSLRIQKGQIAPGKGAPKRIYFDLKPAILAASLPSELTSKNAHILKVRLGQHKEDTVRVVVEVKGNANVTLVNEKSLVARKPATTKEPVLPAIQEPAPKVVLSAPQSDEGILVPHIKKIILDPGHGGDDPGAIGKRGLKEKEVTLAIAKRVKKLVEKQMPNVKVYMTREHDVTVSLPKRTEMANAIGADLFISIHANAAPNPDAQGIETYYLNIAHDRYSIRLAARENAMSESEVSNLEFILADLAMKSSVSDSVRLGDVVQSSILSRVQERWQNTRNLGLKHALFYVLLGARMPAILIETSFISNKEEEKRLKNGDYQHALAEGVVRGIQRFAEERQAMYAP